MTIPIKGKTYELFPKGWINAEVSRVEDKGMMSFSPADEPKPMLLVRFKPENSQDDSTLSVLCTNTNHRQGTLHKIFVAAIGRAPRSGEDAQGLLEGQRLKVLNDHRVNAKDGLTYNKVRDFAPADPPARKPERKPFNPPPGHPQTRSKTFRGSGSSASIAADPVAQDIEITEQDVEDATVPF